MKQRQDLNVYTVEHQMIERKYSQPPVIKMNVEELKTAIQVMLHRICVVTGWVLPETKSSINILVDEFGLYLKETYPTINVNEVAAAFRQFGTTVKDWGRAVNLGLMEQVLAPYMAARLEASRMVEEKPKEMPLLTMPEETPEEKITFAYEHWKKVKTIELTVNVYRELRTTGRMEQPGSELAALIESTVKAKRLELLTHDFQYFKRNDEKQWTIILKQKLACHHYFSNLQNELS